jgi:hypothetical protein
MVQSIRLSKHTADHVAGFGGFCAAVLIRLDGINVARTAHFLVLRISSLRQRLLLSFTLLRWGAAAVNAFDSFTDTALHTSPHGETRGLQNDVRNPSLQAWDESR